MTLRLNGSTSGYVEIDAPATAGSNTLVLPTGNGSNGQYLQTNGAGALSWTSSVMLDAGSASAPSLYISGDTNTGMWSPAADTLAWSTDGSERMRISQGGIFSSSSTGSYINSTNHSFNWDYAGRFFFHNSSGTGSNNYGIEVRYAATPNGTSNEFLYCTDTAGSVLRASIRSNGGLANFSANNANLSDRNAKKDISRAADTWDCIKEWEIVNYRYKDQPDDADLNLGVIAQQVAESCPEVITVFEEAKDDQPEKLGVKEQQMYWMAIKALQEAQVRIESLETRLAALEVTP